MPPVWFTGGDFHVVRTTRGQLKYLIEQLSGILYLRRLVHTSSSQ